MARPILRVYKGGVHVEDLDLQEGRLVVGRGHGCDLLLDDPAVSRKHAVLYVTKDEVVLEDLGSPNGTLVGGVPVRRRSLEPGDHVTLGAYDLHFIGAVEAPMIPPPPVSEGMHIVWSSQEATAYVDPASMTGLPGGPREFPVVEPQGRGEPFTIKGPAALIGRGDDADLRALSLNPLAKDMALITRKGTLCHLARLSPWVTVKVNGRRCREKLLVDGDLIQVGLTRFRIRLPAPATSPDYVMRF